MFAHISDETRNLSHGFLGALFSVLLVFSESDFWMVIGTSIFLYFNFVVLTSALHFYFKAVAQNANGDWSLVWAVMLSFFAFFSWMCFVAFVAVGKLPMFHVDMKEQLLAGLAIYFLFASVMAMAHFTAMSSEEGRSHSESRGGGA